MYDTVKEINVSDNHFVGYWILELVCSIKTVPSISFFQMRKRILSTPNAILNLKKIISFV